MLDFIIVGAGCGGLVLAAQLSRRYPNSIYTILEREAATGGTWYHNTYPGCAVDSPCVAYSMSFDPATTYRQWLPSQSEILQYLHYVAAKYDINSLIRLNAEMLNAVWDDEAKLWAVTYRDRNSSQSFELQSRILISAIGQLVEPSYGGIKGLDCFKGAILHCNRWDTDTILGDKNIVVIGNGASATQVIPSIAPSVRTLTQIIRTTQGYSARSNSHLTPLTIWMFKYIPFYLLVRRFWHLLITEHGLQQFRNTPGGETIRKQNMQKCHEYTKAVAPEKYWDLVLPEYEGRCKRVIGDFGYLESLHRENVELLQDPVVECEKQGVRTESGQRYDADVIIFATGYKSSPFPHLSIRGRNSVLLPDKWGPNTIKSHYKTIAVSDFPNFFTLYGPNAALPNYPAIYSFENNVDLILSTVNPILIGKAKVVEVDPAAEKDFMEELRAALGEFRVEGCRQVSGSKDDGNGESKGKEIWWPWGYVKLWWNTRGWNRSAWMYA
ncbi:hypothetical protein BKA63DRAFT_428924 [Paraphoma chrysanthemicola]|nr:hypothetical protein BKA63DRAFT_428924 [Paraphoma chrysanthemicola]